MDYTRQTQQAISELSFKGDKIPHGETYSTFGRWLLALSTHERSAPKGRFRDC